MDDNVEFYESKVHVKPWRLLTLEPLNVPWVLKHELATCRDFVLGK
jgi:hypothetical protein